MQDSMANKATWTVMVYMAGDNNISDRCIDNIKQMQQIGSTDDVNVLVQFDPKKEGVKTKRYRITKQETDGALERDVVFTFPEETDTGDPKVLEEFLRWGIGLYPQSRYLVILWGHGNGMDDDKPTASGKDTLILTIKSESLIRTISDGDGGFKVATAFGDDENPKDFLSNVELKTVFDAVSADLKRRVDIVGFDSCMMSMAEVYYQLRDSVGHAVGAEGVTPSSSWPYHRVLSALNENPAMSDADLARLLVDKYIGYYSDYGDVSVDLSACDLRQMGQLAEVVGHLARELTSKVTDKSVGPGVRNAIHIAHFFAQMYYGDSYVDLFDFCQLLVSSCEDEKVRAACRAVMELIDQENGLLVLSSKHTDADAHPFGISIYFPWDTVNEVYKNLEFPRATNWLDFITAYIDVMSPARIK
jgi:hypothetical protein